MTAYGYVYIYIYGCIWIDFDARDLLHAAAQTPRDHVMKCSVAQGISMNSVGLVKKTDPVASVVHLVQPTVCRPNQQHGLNSVVLATSETSTWTLIFFGFGTFWEIQHENSGSFSGVSALLDLFACSTLDFNQQKNILLDASMKYLSLSTITIYLS